MTNPGIPSSSDRVDAIVAASCPWKQRVWTVRGDGLTHIPTLRAAPRRSA